MVKRGFALYLFTGFLALGLPWSFVNVEMLSTEPGILRSQILFVMGAVAAWTWSGGYWLSRFFNLESQLRPLRKDDLRFFFVGILGLLLMAAITLPVLSVDCFYYICEGRMIAIHELSPYANNLWTISHDPVVSKVRTGNFHYSAPYGPVAMAFFTLANVLGLFHTNLHLLTALLKLTWVPLHGLLCWASYRLCRKHRHPWTLTFAVLANPALIWMGLVDGHLDILIACLTLCLAYFVASKRPILAGLTVSGAGAVKVVGVVAVPIVFCLFLRRSWKLAISFGAIFALSYAAMYVPLGGGEYNMVLNLSSSWDKPAASSLIPRLFLLLGMENFSTVRVLSDGIFYSVVAFTCWSSWRGWLGERPCLALALPLTTLFLTRVYYQPWYTLWFWPLLWFAQTSEKDVRMSIVLWTVCVILAQSTPWSIRIWILSAGILWSLYTAFRTGPNVRGPAPDSLPS